MKKTPLKCLVALTIAVFVVTLFFGLRTKGYHFSNDVTWLSKPPGIRFNGHGIVYTAPIKDFSMAGDLNHNGYSIEIAFEPKSYHENGFNFLFAIHNGDDSKQLLIGQWRSWLIAMNGDDYGYKRKSKRITVKLSEESSTPQFATLTSGKNGVSFYLGNRLIRMHKDLTLKIPEGNNARFLLGNSVYGRNHWHGDVLGLVVYPRPLSEKEVANHFKRWLKDKSFLSAREPKPVALYVFDEHNGAIVMDHSGGNIDFHIPTKMKMLTKKILSFSWSELAFNAEFFEDVMINLVGFLPLGFFLNATFSRVSVNFERNSVLITIVLCFFVSLFIEICQAWIPSRSSDILDLVLNTTGGGVGGALWLKARNWRTEDRATR